MTGNFVEDLKVYRALVQAVLPSTPDAEKKRLAKSVEPAWFLEFHVMFCDVLAVEKALELLPDIEIIPTGLPQGVGVCFVLYNRGVVEETFDFSFLDDYRLEYLECFAEFWSMSLPEPFAYSKHVEKVEEMQDFFRLRMHQFLEQIRRS